MSIAKCTLHQPSSLYNLSFVKFIATLRINGITQMPLLHKKLEYLPHTIQRDFHRRVTLCNFCTKLHIDGTFPMVRASAETNYQETRICQSCVEAIDFTCWACTQHITVEGYTKFVSTFKSFSRMHEIPAIMTNYVRRDPTKYITLCYRCDNLFLPCDYCGTWINET